MTKQAKSTADCPLWKHPNGQWGKKIRGKLRYFDTDQTQAVHLYLDEQEARYAGRKPKRNREGDLW